MAIEITARHVEIPEAVRGHALKRMEKLQAEFPNVSHIHAILTIEKYRSTAEVVVQAKRQPQMEAMETSDDMYASIDKAAEKMETRLRKTHDKRRDHKSRIGLAEMEERKVEQEE